MLEDLHRIILNIDNLKELISKIDIQKNRSHNIEFDIERLNEELDTLSRRKKSAYEDYQDGIITKAEYIEYRDAYEEQIEKQQKSLAALEERKHTKIKEDIFEYEWVRKLLDMRAVDQLDRSIVLDMINEIKVYNDKRIKIVYNFSDDLENILKLNAITPS